MRPLWKDMLTAFLLGMILPGILLNTAVMLQKEKSAEPEEVPFLETAAVPTGVTVRLRNGAAVTELDLEIYLTGVVLAEMPAFFETEALKAQAVAARTYTRKASVTGGKHGDGSVCSDPGCCQAYLSAEQYFTRGGTADGLEKVGKAVAATAGQVLTYGGELIEATYFSCSGGSTEDAAAVWGIDFPYLQATPSPGEEQSPVYQHAVHYTLEQFQAALGRELDGNPTEWFGIPTYTEGGGIAHMAVGGEIYTGTQIRNLLGLRSTVFILRVSEDGITITTRGYGHRVGMSQYGADTMALAGNTYRDILAHYYPGTELTRLS